MKTLHILPNQRTADILRRAGVPQQSIFAFPVLLAETDRSQWADCIPHDIYTYDKIIVWHGNDANSLLLLALLSTLHLPLWHINACKHKRMLRRKEVLKKRNAPLINIVTMSEKGIRLLYGKEKPVHWWQILRNKKRWNYAFKFPMELVQHDNKGLYFFANEWIEALCLCHLDDTAQPLTIVLSKIMTYLEMNNEYFSEGFLAEYLHHLAGKGIIEMHPTANRAKEKFGQLTDVNYQLRRTSHPS